MLVLSRKRDQKIVLRDPAWGYSIELDVVELRGDRVRIGFTAPARVAIWRSELGVFERSLRMNGQAVAERAIDGADDENA